MLRSKNRPLSAARRRLFRPLCEQLEPRLCFSVFYDYDVMAQSGANGITSILPSASINDSGNVAFVANVSGGQDVFVATSTTVTGISSNVSSSRTYGQELQINNSGVVAVVDSNAGATMTRGARIRGPGVGAFSNIALSSSPLLNSDHFDALGLFTSISNDGQLAFAGLNSTVWDIHLANTQVDRGDFGSNVATFATGTFFRHMAADGDRIVIASRQGTDKHILLYDTTGIDTSVGIASIGSTWSELGIRPGISDDGRAVAFIGDRGNGLGVFLSIEDDAGIQRLVRVAGENAAAGGPPADLGYDGTGNKLFFNSFELDTRVSVVHQSLGAAGLLDDTFIVSFLGTPNAASRNNPVDTGSPLFFNNQLGIWTVDVLVQQQLASPGTVLAYNSSGATSVVQVGESVGGATITGLAVGDSIALATTDEAGAARDQRRGDHQVVFQATTSGGTRIVRARHLDSDEDGLLDHWETGGIDINQDGTVDLNLAAMGANVNRRDIFIEMDHLAPRTSGVPTNWNNQLAPGVTQWLVDMFNNAPALPNGIAAGITLHIDVGSGGESRNMGTGSLEGGDQIGQPGEPNTHIDVVHFGRPDASNTVPGVETRSFDSIKDNFFGRNDKRARELAFHYAVSADFHSFITTTATSKVAYTASITAASANTLTSAAALPTHLPLRQNGTNGLIGKWVMITSGKGAGQLRRITGLAGNTLTIGPNWSNAANTPDATSTFTLIDGSSGKGEAHFRGSPNNQTIPGNDFLLTLGGFGVKAGGVLGGDYIQQRTIAHELGHNLGLRHGGIDHNAYKGASYLSLMSYSHQTKNPSAVLSFAGAADPTYNDWANLRLDFQSSIIHLGNTFVRGPNGEEEVSDDPLFDIADHEILNNSPVDVASPTVTFNAPTSNQAVGVGQSILVNVSASDDVSIATVSFAFDIDGNGDTAGPGENVVPTLTGGFYQATFLNVSGPLGTRAVVVTATDTSLNETTASQNIDVQSAPSNSAPTVATAAAISPNPVQGSMGNLSVLGADDGGEAALTYTWSVLAKPTGAADPSFSANGTNAAKNSVATFSASGNYQLRATISDGTLSTTSDVSFAVDLLPAQNDDEPFDVNDDNAVNISDLIDLITLIVDRGQGPAPIPNPSDNPKYYPDVNGDTLMDIFDLIDLIDRIVNAPSPATPPAPAVLESGDEEAASADEELFAVLAADADDRRRRERH